MSQARFQKQQREKARRERAAAKSARRDERRSQTDDDKPATTASEQSALLAELATLHERFDAGEIAFEDFVTAKEELTERLAIE